ncbi:MAG: hypothetical protein CVT88_00545 [Candidatus Altiarchaeales archaeon HGW-Altiarchaeales-1]|nr:MAG: hypothetical protein CVT88_00545 [Candidatus Altiarchaeales archaeon HGW-Altiarchaeales-1]
MEVSIQLPLYAIAIVGSFLQFPFAQIFKFLEGYGKDVIHSHNEINNIQWAWIISLLSWIICIVCVGTGLSLYFIEPLIGKYLLENIAGALLLLLCMSSLGAVISVLKYCIFLREAYIH